MYKRVRSFLLSYNSKFLHEYFSTKKKKTNIILVIQAYIICLSIKYAIGE